MNIQQFCYRHAVIVLNNIPARRFFNFSGTLGQTVIHVSYLVPGNSKNEAFWYTCPIYGEHKYDVAGCSGVRVDHDISLITFYRLH